MDYARARLWVGMSAVGTIEIDDDLGVGPDFRDRFGLSLTDPVTVEPLDVDVLFLELTLDEVDGSGPTVLASDALPATPPALPRDAGVRRRCPRRFRCRGRRATRLFTKARGPEHLARGRTALGRARPPDQAHRFHSRGQQPSFLARRPSDCLPVLPLRRNGSLGL